MGQEKMRMPSGMGGLVRYFDEYKSKLEFKPGHIVVLIIAVIILMAILYTFGAAMFGL
ncbi:preprotein translocase subunit Sec61beta [Candidatus Woesearchaeota archaeon]|nr:preprotein translocase subunit Sec61beta [Candidatus Woesearchaeota archaeon]